MVRPRPRLLVSLAAAALVAAAGCDAVGPPAGPAPFEVAVPAGFDPLPVPAQNPLSAERVALGERLFFDPALSGDGTVACATCHRPELAFTDGLPRSRGVRGETALRNAPSLLNVAYQRTLFWDGGTFFLESQALVPLAAPHEMDAAVGDVLARLGAAPAYPALFAAAFDGQGPSVQTLTYALAAYERTLVSTEGPYDRYRNGDAGALPPEARRGHDLFFGRAGCAACHAGFLLTTQAFENNGLAVTDEDPGRQRVTFDPADRGRFKVPGLRNVARTAPYMHDGRFATLDAVLDHYDRGGEGTPGQSPLVRPLHLTAQERADLLAFLGALSDDPPSP